MTLFYARSKRQENDPLEKCQRANLYPSFMDAWHCGRVARETRRIKATLNMENIGSRKARNTKGFVEGYGHGRWLDVEPQSIAERPFTIEVD